jgi:hypothetical protein
MVQPLQAYQWLNAFQGAINQHLFLAAIPFYRKSDRHQDSDAQL